jgi:hypothetical protein
MLRWRRGSRFGLRGEPRTREVPGNSGVGRSAALGRGSEPVTVGLCAATDYRRAMKRRWPRVRWTYAFARGRYNGRVSGAMTRAECYMFFCLDVGASFDQVRAVYRAYARAWHPDRLVGESPQFGSIADAVMKRANEAYSVLEKIEQDRQSRSQDVAAKLQAERDRLRSAARSHVCQACGSSNAMTFKYCGECGASLPRYVPSATKRGPASSSSAARVVRR